MKKISDFLLKNLASFVLLCIGVALIVFTLVSKNFAFSHPLLIERVYSRTLYPQISQFLCSATGLVDFSIAEIALIAIVASTVLRLIAGLIAFIVRRDKLGMIFRCFCAIVFIGSIFLSGLYILWGYNYARMPLDSSIGLNLKNATVDELYSVCEILAQRANTLRDEVSENKDGVFALESDEKAEFTKVVDAFENMSHDHSLFARKITPAKPIIFSKVLSKTGIRGIFVPFTAESNVNVDGPPLLFAASAAHENAHLCGFAREDEANFIAFLACSYSDDPSVEYSGTMLALLYAGNALYSEDAQAYSNLYASYSDGVKRDFISHAEYSRSLEGPIDEAFSDLNDAYLKSNRLEDGVKSYGRMVDLLIAYFENKS